ncbi:methylmalonyl-CoA mutase family protein [Mycobacterium xenopi 4042]|uniref:Methylmalonyl-CoA mutase family protein n=1 Tax=Mycobacterium xenopi 4042 TaxID=1299334 RepID=X7YQ24_MYCXE|nr:methylmalonyl-CoA mutase family protein [Mycobacterium xenopi 4042]
MVGEPDSGTAVVHAETSLPMMTQRDPWVNMLRTTLAAFGAGVGGADTVRVLPFDAAIPGVIRARRRPSRAASPATPSCCCWRSRTSAASSTRPVAPGTSKTSPKSWPAGLAAFPGHRGAWRLCRGPRLSERSDRPGCCEAHRRHRAPPHRRYRSQRIPEPR